MVSRDLILNNFWWKVTALLLAIIVWFVVKGGNLPESSASQLIPARHKEFANHPLMIVREATDHRRIEIEPTEVMIEVSGPPAEMAALRAMDIQAFVDLAEVRPDGRARIRVYLPRRISLERLDPTEARVQIVVSTEP